MFWRKFLSLILAVILSLGNMSFAYQADGNGSGGSDGPLFNIEDFYFFHEAASDLHNVVDLQPEFSSILLRVGSDKMDVDGETIDILPPARMEGKILVPVSDIAEAAGAYVDIDLETGGITVESDGRRSVWNTHAREAAKGARALQVYENGTVEWLNPDGRMATAKPLYDLYEIADLLSMEAAVYEDTIILTKSCQLGQLLVQAKDLPDTYGAVEYRTNNNGLYVLQYADAARAKAAYEALKKDSNVTYVKPNAVRALTSNSSTEADRPSLPYDGNWGTTRIYADGMKEHLGDPDTEIIVAVIDSGLDNTHPFFEGRYVPGRRFYTNLAGNQVENDDTKPVNPHGTHTAGTVVECSPENVKVMPISVFYYNSSYQMTATDTSVALGIAWSVENGAKVINMSLGGWELEDDPEPSLMGPACDLAVAAGVVVVASSGNEGLPAKIPGVAMHVPSSYDSVISVAATDQNDAMAGFSNYGSEGVDVSAPGVNILSTVPNNSYAYMDGTSMASPHVAAAAAMLLTEDPTRTPEQVRAALIATCVPLGEYGNSEYGAGVIDFRIYLGGSQIAPETMELNRREMTVALTGKVGTEEALYATLGPLEATDKSITVEIADPGIAGYKDGKVFGEKEGKTVITLTSKANPELTASCEVTVTYSRVWMDYAADGFAGGDGSEGNPYLISSAEELAYFAKRVFEADKFENKYLKLTADIDLGTEGRIWLPIQGYDELDLGGGYIYLMERMFRGNFDGDYHVISNMDSRSDPDGYDFTGLFGCMVGGSIKRLGVDGTAYNELTESGSPVAGIMLGGMYNTVISECFTTGESDLGTFVGTAYGGTIENCFSTATGAASGFISRMGDQTASSYPKTNITIRNCYSAGSMIQSAYDANSGGFAMSVFAPVINCFSASRMPEGRPGFIYAIGDDNRRASLSYCYYLDENGYGIDVDNTALKTQPEAKSAEWFRTEANFTNPENWDASSYWDFNNIWVMDAHVNDGLPYLKGFYDKLPDEDEAQTPVIERQPGDAVATVGDAVTLSVEASVTDGGTLSYQWYANTEKSAEGGIAIENADGPTFSAPTNTAGTTYYYVVVTNTITGRQTKTASTTSDVAAVTVEPAAVAVRVGVSTPTIVSTLSAYLNITVTGAPEGANLNAYLEVGGELLHETPITNGAGRMYIPKAPEVAADTVYRLVVKGGGYEGECDIKVVFYNTDIWVATAFGGANGYLNINFNAPISSRTNFAKSVTIGGTAYNAAVEGGNTLVVKDVAYGDLEAGEKIVISGVKYQELFPSYSFTFTVYR